MNFFNTFITGFRKIQFNIDNFSSFKIQNLKVRNGLDFIYISNYSTSGNSIEIILADEINIKEECFLLYDNLTVKAKLYKLFSTEEFNNKYYTDSNLGYFYNTNYTVFKVWSPVAKCINILLYEKAEPMDNDNPIKIPMSETNGLWFAQINKDLKNYFYTYEIHVLNSINEAVDPYAKSVGINGLRGAIIDMNETNPEKWYTDFISPFKNFNDAIIYETNIRDISIHPNSGVLNKGKFLGLAEENTVTDNNISTALNHIKELGITHMQLMPIFDFSHISVNEKKSLDYNWGYDPQNYNVPEGSYSTNPYDPYCRIKELKLMIQSIHKNGIYINMDVVYNHVFNGVESNFEKIFPEYYFRQNDNCALSNGSGCGNDTASEHLMMRKFILDSLLYWIDEYHIDGFRFDLMGLHDIETMNYIRENLPNHIMTYGEGWDLGTNLPSSSKASINNAKKMPKISFFNDIIRDSIKGSVFSSSDKGFATGKNGLEDKIRLCATGCIEFSNNLIGPFITPSQSINYVSAHDNHTLWDKIDISCADDNWDNKIAMDKLCNAIVLTCLGIPFLHSGAEFCRTKLKEHNSYKSPDNINWIDWKRKNEFLNVYNYYKGLIKIRKEHSSFKMDSLSEIKSNINFLPTESNVVAFMLCNHANNDIWKDIIVIYNSNKHAVTINIPEDKWTVVCNKDFVDSQSTKCFTGSKIVVDSISTNIIYRI